MDFGLITIGACLVQTCTSRRVTCERIGNVRLKCSPMHKIEVVCEVALGLMDSPLQCLHQRPTD
jgi:hypothetical protein